MTVGDQVSRFIQECRTYYKHRYGTLRPPFPDELVSQGEPVVQALGAVLQEEDVEARWSAVYALGEIGRLALDPLVEALEDPDPEIRIQTVQALGRIGAPALDPLSDALEDADAVVRRNTVQALAKIGEPAQEALTRALEDPEEEVRNQVIYSLLDAGAWALPLHVAALEDSWWWQSLEWLTELAHTQPNEVAKAILQELVARTSGRPAEQFNQKVVVHALKEVIQRSPEMNGTIHTRLCDLAFAHTGDVRSRAVAVGESLDASRFLAMVQARQRRNVSAATAIMDMLGKQAETFSEQEIQTLGRLKEFRTLLIRLEGLSQERWAELVGQARRSLAVQWALSGGLFGIGAAMIVWGLVQVAPLEGLWIPLAGGLFCLAAAVVMSLGIRFWHDPTARILGFTSKQALVQATFLGFISRVAQVRMVFENHCATGELSLGDLERYQKVLGDAIAQASALLSDERDGE